MNSFEFKCDDAFAIAGLGLVLAGNLKHGELRSNQLVSIPILSRIVIGRISSLERNRKLVDHVESDEHIGILFREFNDDKWNQILSELPKSEEDCKKRTSDSLIDNLGIEFPCVLTGPLPESAFPIKRLPGWKNWWKPLFE